MNTIPLHRGSGQVAMKIFTPIYYMMMMLMMLMLNLVQHAYTVVEAWPVIMLLEAHACSLE